MSEFVALERDECFELLQKENLGRFGVVVDGVPLMSPVNYTLDGEVITFRTAPGTKYDASLHNKVSFEVDHVEPDGHSAWSVLVVGSVDRLGMMLEDRERVEHMPIQTMVPGDHPVLTRIVADKVTGRRVQIDDDAT